MPCTRFSALRQGSSRNSTAILISLPPRAILADLDEHLAEVLAAEQADERLGRLLEALDDVLAVLQLALAQPARAVGEELRSEEHTSELQSPCNLVCRLLLEKKKKR